MAVTNPTHVDTSIPEIWARNTLREHLVEGFWNRFVGGPGSPIVRQTELLNGPGDLIHIQVTNPLTGAGVSGDTAVLEGNEENLSTTEIKCQTTLYRHGVRFNRRANKKSILDLRSEASMRLAEWGMDKMDDLRWTNLTGTSLTVPAGETYNPYSFAVGYPTTSGATADTITVAATGYLTVASCSQIKLKLQLQHAKPIMVGGRPHYFLVTHPNALYQLKRETEYRDWVREAEVRGAGNPFFTGATVMIDGLVIFDHENCPTATNGSGHTIATGCAFGQEFAVEALDENVSWDEDMFDYGMQFGIGYGFAFQTRRALELSSCQVFATASSVVAEES